MVPNLYPTAKTVYGLCTVRASKPSLYIVG